MQIVVQVGARRDDEVDKATFHHLDDTTAEPGRRQGAGDGQTNRGVVVFVEHLVRENLTRFRQTAGVEGLKSLLDQVANLRATRRPVVLNGLA